MGVIAFKSYEPHSRFMQLWLTWSHDGGSGRKLRINRYAIGKSVAGWSSGESGPIRVRRPAAAETAAAPACSSWEHSQHQSGRVNNCASRVALSTDRRGETYCKLYIDSVAQLSLRRSLKVVDNGGIKGAIDRLYLIVCSNAHVDLASFLRYYQIYSVLLLSVFDITTCLV